jgi:acetoin utilization deacetylase AcuC-like enzyme
VATVVVSHPDCIRHDTGPGHPESARRLDALLAAVDETIRGGAAERIVRVEARRATDEELGLVHPEPHIRLIRETARRASERRGLIHLDPDTVVSPGSWDAATAAAGAVLTAVDALLDGPADHAFCAVRPPGHHATADRAMGFCLFNNVAIGVRYAQGKGLRRALIVDWDVHHGNGTEAIFYADPDVYYLSMHQSPHYPGTGAATDRGRGAGEGTTLNLPVPPGLPAERYVAELLTGLETALADLGLPDIVFVSAGFDAARGDPLAGLTLEPADYDRLTRRLVDAAETCCRGRIVSVLEGGYDLRLLAECALAHLRALAGLEPEGG